MANNGASFISVGWPEYQLPLFCTFIWPFN